MCEAVISLPLATSDQDPTIPPRTLVPGFAFSATLAEAFVEFFDERHRDRGYVGQHAALRNQSRQCAEDDAELIIAVLYRHHVGRFTPVEAVDGEPGLGELLVQLERGLAELEAVTDDDVEAVACVVQHRLFDRRIGQALGDRDANVVFLLGQLDALIGAGVVGRVRDRARQQQGYFQRLCVGRRSNQQQNDENCEQAFHDYLPVSAITTSLAPFRGR